MPKHIAAMTKGEITKRIILSRQTYWKYNSFPGPMAGPDEDALALIRAEIDLLRRWAIEFPARSRALLVLAEEWELMSVRFMGKAN